MLPAGWRRVRLDSVASISAWIGWKALTADEYVPDGYVFLSTPNIKAEEIDYEQVKYVSEFRYQESPDLQLQEGDVLLAKDGNTLGITNVVRSLPRPATVNGSIAVLRPRNFDSRFLRYVLASHATQSLIQAIKGGMGVPHLFQADLKRFPVPRPPLDVQVSLSDYLDTETARIDALVTKKREMIKLLEQRFDSAVFHMVAGGHVLGPKRYSGVAWLGDIPESWTAQPVSANFGVTLGKMVNPEATVGDEQYPYVRNTNVKWDGFDLEDLDEMHFDASDRRKCTLQRGDLLVCEGGEVGRAAVWDEQVTPCFFQKAIHRVRPLHGGSTRFLMYCLRAAASRGVFAVEGNQSTIVHLTREKLRVHRFPFPDVQSQTEIVKRLDAEGDRVQSLTKRLDRQVRLLAEHRQALITAACAGELDIPGAAA